MGDVCSIFIQGLITYSRDPPDNITFWSIIALIIIVFIFAFLLRNWSPLEEQEGKKK